MVAFWAVVVLGVGVVAAVDGVSMGFGGPFDQLLHWRFHLQCLFAERGGCEM